MPEIYTLSSPIDDYGLYKGASQPQDEASNENGQAVTKKEKLPSCLQNLKYYLWEFCSRTTVHGFTYLGERGRLFPERIWWLVTIVVSLYFCITLIMGTYQKWVTFPVMVTFATSQTPIRNIPFPAVTICSDVKSRMSRFNYSDMRLKVKNKEKMTEKETTEFEYMTLLCNPDLDLLNKSLATIDKRAVDFLLETAPYFNRTFFKVTWMEQEVKEPAELFSPLFTSEGLCYTFNALDKSEIYTDIVTNYKNSYFSRKGKSSTWSLESGYFQNVGKNGYPRRTFTAGVDGGLNIQLAVPRKDIDYTCGDNLQGFKVILHNPEEVPSASDNNFRVPLDHWVSAAVKPIMMTTSEDLRFYKPKDRQCYFAKERTLKYYRIYNQRNCLGDCLVDFALDRCGCVGFNLERENSTPICSSYRHNKCMVEARASYLETELEATKKCDCLPACNSLDFDVEISQAEWNWQLYYEAAREYRDWNPEEDLILQGMHLSQLTVFFKDMQFTTSERNELYGQTDFWANCGGLLGLFTGFSFMSALEILYYLTLRFICNFYKYGRHYWCGAEELLAEKKKEETNQSS